MSFVLNTNAVDEADRAEFVHEALAATIVPIELHWLPKATGAAARGVITNLGDLTICSGRTSAFRVERTPALARDAHEPSIFVNVQVTGSSVVVQGDQEAVLQPGGLVICDSTAPYTLLNDSGMAGEFFRIPRSALALPHNVSSNTRANTSTTRICAPNESRSRTTSPNATCTGCWPKATSAWPTLRGGGYGSSRPPSPGRNHQPQPPLPPSPGVTDSPTCPASAARSAPNMDSHLANGATSAPAGDTRCMGKASMADD
jgi:hypothetical protein